MINARMEYKKQMGVEVCTTSIQVERIQQGDLVKYKICVDGIYDPESNSYTAYPEEYVRWLEDHFDIQVPNEEIRKLQEKVDFYEEK